MPERLSTAPAAATPAGTLLPNTLRALVALGAAAFAALVIVLRHRGLDLTDEGFYLLGLRPAQDRAEVMFDWQHILVRLTGGRELEMGTWRVIAVVVLLAGAAIFALGLRRFLRATGTAGEVTRHGGAIAALAAFGMLGYFRYLPPTISYNVLTGLVVYGVAGVSLAVLADPWPAGRAARTRRLGMTAAGGVLLALQLWVKAPVIGTLALAIAAFGLVVPLRVRRTVLLYHLAAAIVGMAVGVALYLLVVRPPAEFLALARRQVEMVSGSGHGPATLLGGYWVDIKAILGLAVRLFPVWLVAGGIAWATSRARPLRPTAKLGLAGAGVLAAAWTATLFWRRGFVTTESVAGFFLQRSWMYSSLLTILVAAWIGARLGRRAAVVESRAFGDEPSTTRARVALLLLLLCLPPVAVFGSNLGFPQSFVYPAGWMVAWVLMCEQIAAAHRRLHAPAYLAALAAVVVAALEFWQGVVTRPYQLGASRLSQTERLRTAAPEVGPVLVTPRMRAFVDSVGTVLLNNGYRRGEPIMQLYFTSGLTYLLGGRSPATPAFMGKEENQARNCYMLAHPPTAERPRFYLMSMPALPATRACLPAFDARVPAGLRLLARVPMPYRGRGRTLDVYVVD